MSTIRAASYSEIENQLAADPIVHALAHGVSRTPRAELAHEGGTPRHEFMGAANDEYRSRGGQIAGHLGAVARAILAVLDEDPVGHWFQTSYAFADVVSTGRFRRYEVRPGVVIEHKGTRYRVTAVHERDPGTGAEFRIVTVRPV